MTGLPTFRQRRFVAAYTGEARGNGALAARLAGYAASSAAVEASRLLRNAHVSRAIQEAGGVANDLATAEEAKCYVSTLLRDERQPASIRLRACEVLAKMQGWLPAKHIEIAAPVDPVVAMVARMTPEERQVRVAELLGEIRNRVPRIEACA